MKGTILYDVSSTPLGVTIENIINIYAKTGFLLYDSAKSNVKMPVVFGEQVKDIKILNTSEAVEVFKRCENIRKTLKL